MPVYDLRCDHGHHFEVLQAFSAALPDCPCGAPTTKVPSAFAVTGSATVPPPDALMPQTWRGTHGGDRAYLHDLQRTAERRRALEDRHPELAADERPIVAHEGRRYANAPLRAGGSHTDGRHGHSHEPRPASPPDDIV